MGSMDTTSEGKIETRLFINGEVSEFCGDELGDIEGGCGKGIRIDVMNTDTI